MNLIIDTDSYKSSHWLQYPPGTTNIYNYLEARGGEYKKSVFFGLQYLLKEYLSKPVSMDDVDDADKFFRSHGVPFNREGWEGIVKDHGGYIPMEIRAVKEGSVVPIGQPLLTCTATDPKYFWVVGWFETMIMRLWYPITVATLSYEVKGKIKDYMNKTCDDLTGLPFKLHDFGSRGVSSRESAAIGGAAHLVNFMGSDTVVGVAMANDHYGAHMSGFSIPAAEHSTITSWGQEGEVAAYRNMLKQFAKPGAIVAVVSDSYDIFKAANDIWGGILKEDVVKSGAVVVIRPDSGEPIMVVTRLLYDLESKFGSKTNSKGYRVLNNVRVIQGDGMTPVMIERVLEAARLAGFSADNLAFGMGGGLLQQVNRDTMKFAYKCSAVEIDGEWKDVFKDPITDPGKKSKKGRVTSLFDGKTYSVGQIGDKNDILVPVYRNGERLQEIRFDQVRENSSL